MHDRSKVAEAIAAFNRADLVQARELVERELDKGPSPELHHLLGLIHCRQGAPAAGIPWLRQATDADPDNLAYRTMLVRALVDSGRAVEALALAPQPTGTAPADLPLWHARAEAADRAGDASEAAAAWNAICTARPADWQPWANLGRNLLKLDRLDEAEQAYGQAVKAAPAEERAIHRMIGRDADAAGQASVAFAAAARINHATEGLAEWRQQASDYRADLRALAAAITPEWVARLPRPETPADPSVAFLVGFPRSGTTLLDTFLLGHPEVTVIEERGLLNAAAEVVGPLAGLVECPSEIRARARQTYFERRAQELRGAAAPIIVDKAPLNMVLAPLIPVLFGGAPIIFAQRHPCDVVLSGFMQSLTPNLRNASFLDIADAADFYDAAMQLWTTAAQQLGLRTHTVVYEELVRDPSAALRPAVEFLGLDWNEAVLDHQTTARVRGPVLNPSRDQITEPLSDRPAGRWRRYEEQLAPVLPVLLPWAERLGYQA